LHLDKKETIKRRAVDDGDFVRFCDKRNNYKGWYNRDTDTNFLQE